MPLHSRNTKADADEGCRSSARANIVRSRGTHVLSSWVNLDFLTLKMTGDGLLGSDSCSMLQAVSNIRRNIKNGYFNAVLHTDN
jgi:hypothetical protein